jgi:hypothetical protein
MSVCNGSNTSNKHTDDVLRDLLKNSMAPGKQLFIGRAWSMALIQPHVKMSH